MAENKKKEKHRIAAKSLSDNEGLHRQRKKRKGQHFAWVFDNLISEKVYLRVCSGLWHSNNQQS